MPEGGDRLITRGASVRVQRAGAGAPLLFLHGAGGWPAWLPFFDRLSQRYALTVPEHPCFGGSDDPPWLRDIADLAMYYLDLLDQNFSVPVHVIGHSLGGWTAAEAALRNTGRIASLTLIAPAGIRVKGVPPGDIFIWSPEEFERNRFHDQSHVAAAPQVPTSEEELDIALQTRLAAVKFGWEPRLFNPDLEKWLHRINVPTHIVWGREDRILPSVYAQLWSERVPKAKVTMVEACGHSPHVEHVDRVTEKVLAFLGGRHA
ncbi:MAG: alpha/beta fold hydrolase [Xanthobacteraceae bacterium]